MLHTDALSPRNFLAMKQEKTLALAQALQTCTKESGVTTGILCELAWEVQMCMAPLMTLSRDDIVEVSLLTPIGEEHETSPTPVRETALLGKEIKLPQCPGSPPEWLEIPRFVEPAKQSTTPSASSPPPYPNLVTSLLRKPRNPSKGWKPILTTQAGGSTFNYKSMTEYQNGVENFVLSSAPRMNV